jgi:hypothetical protein
MNDGDGKLGSVGVMTGLHGAVDESEEFVETADPFRFKVKNLSRRSSPLAMMLKCRICLYVVLRRARW